MDLMVSVRVFGRGTKAPIENRATLRQLDASESLREFTIDWNALKSLLLMHACRLESAMDRLCAHHSRRKVMSTVCSDTIP